MLELQVDLPTGRGRRAALESALRDAVRAGRLTIGASLPSTRVLAADLGVSRSTVVAAYEQLTAEGFLATEQGSGTRVAGGAAVTAPSPDADLMGPTPRWDLRPGEPAAGSFPARAWMQSVRRVLSDDGEGALSYADPRGRVELRSELADYVGRTRSVLADPSAVFVVAGFASGLGFLADSFVRRGIERIAVEEAMLPIHRFVLRAAGLAVDSVAVDDEGLVVDDLASLTVGAVLVTPANQYPYGVTMSPARRAELVEWAAATDAWIVEDDYDGEFRYDRRPIGALQALAPQRVVYAGTASKSLAGGLRLGWLVVPEPLRADLLFVTNARSGVSTLDQLALADFVERGNLDRHVRAMRRTYDDRRQATIARIADAAPDLTLTPSQAGLQLCLPLGGIEQEQAVLAAAAPLELGLLGLCSFHRAPAHRAGLSIGYSRPAGHAWAGCLDRLGAALQAIVE